jgi:DNA-binding FadR family transcriptional regulator
VADFAMQTVSRVSVADAVHDQLRSAILAEIQPVGSLLPSETELAAQAGVNRQAVREALQRLRQVGMVEIVQGGGARVLDWRRRGTLSLLSAAMFRADGPVDPAVIASAFRLRMVTMVDAARLAAERRTDALVSELRTILGRIDVPSDRPAIARSEYWNAVVTASGNVAYRLVFNTQLSIAWKLPAETLASTLGGPDVVPTYTTLTDAIEASDADAAAAAAAALLSPAVEQFTRMSTT